MSELLGLYERFKTDHASLFGEVATIWDRKPALLALPLRIDEIRRAFPFPLMNPVVKSHEPRAMRERLEGKGTPIWRWSKGDVVCMFFASDRDFDQYSASDEFYSLAIPDGRGLLVLVPVASGSSPAGPVVSWLKEHGKLTIAAVPQLLSDFLFSAAGEIHTLPGDLSGHLDQFKRDSSDGVLSRKAGIYSDAIDEIVDASLPKAQHFCDQNPPDAETIWGGSQIRDRNTAVCGLSLAFSDLSSEHRALLSRLRELFRGGREGRGAGDLNRLGPRGGTVSLANDLLPRTTKGKQAADALAIGRLEAYLSRQHRESLSRLASLVSRQNFLKLTNDEDRNRILEALWRSARQDFTFEDGIPSLADVLRRLKGQTLPVLEEAQNLEKRAKEELGLTGINFGSDEVFVKASGGFRELSNIVESASSFSESAGASLVRALLRVFVDALDLSGTIKSVQAQCATLVQSIESLSRTAANLTKNYYEFPQAMRFLGISKESALEGFTKRELSIKKTLALAALAEELADRQDRISQVAQQLNRVQQSLLQLRDLLEGTGSNE